MHQLVLQRQTVIPYIIHLFIVYISIPISNHAGLPILLPFRAIDAYLSPHRVLDVSSILFLTHLLHVRSHLLQVLDDHKVRIHEAVNAVLHAGLLASV